MHCFQLVKHAMAEQAPFVPTGRRSRQWNLGEEIRSRIKPMHFSAPLGIVGIPGVGRKTLALRFAAMDADTLTQDKPQALYSSYHLRTSSSHNPGPVTVHLLAYICPPPVGSTLDPLFHRQQWDRFCCLVFVFDVTRGETFTCAKGFMINYADNLTRHILVGNKCDLRASGTQQNTVAKSDAEAEAGRLGIKYYEISASRKVNVQALLEDIQDCALQEKYLMNL